MTVRFLSSTGSAFSALRDSSYSFAASSIFPALAWTLASLFWVTPGRGGKPK